MENLEESKGEVLLDSYAVYQKVKGECLQMFDRIDNSLVQPIGTESALESFIQEFG